MSQQSLDLGGKLGETRSVPQWIQAAICAGGMALFFGLAQAGLAPVIVLIPALLGGVFAVYFAVRSSAALCTTLAVYENGLQLVDRGKAAAFRFDQLTEITATYTHHKVNQKYIGSRVRAEFMVEGRFSPYAFEGEFLYDKRGQEQVMMALAMCSEAIERRLLAELEREGAICWRDNVYLTADGIERRDSADSVRLIPYREIAEWKIEDNELKIWRNGEGLPCFVAGNETPNFGPLYRLFQSLWQATRSLDPTCQEEPRLVDCA